MNIQLIFYIMLLTPMIGIFTMSTGVITRSINTKFWKLILLIFTGVTFISSFLIWIMFFVNGTFPESSIRSITVNGLNITMLFLANSLFFLTGVFSLYYIKPTRISIYGTLIFTIQLGIQLVLVANHFFVLFIFWELMVLAGYVLVIFDKTDEALEAGYKYLILSSIGSMSMLFGIGLLTMYTDTLYLDMIVLSRDFNSLLGKIALFSIILGFSVTGGAFAFNHWLPDAHPAAPSPVSGILSGIVVKIGIYGIYKTTAILIPYTGLNQITAQILMVIGIVTITEGNIMVFAQFLREDGTDLKRIFAYSTITHLGYLILVAGINTDLSRIALIYHIINHGVAKALLFMLTGYLIMYYGSKDMKTLRNFKIGEENKIISLFLVIPLMSLGGLPLTGGFISKLLILLSVYDQSNIVGTTFAFVIILLAIINSTFAFGGYLWIIKELVFSDGTSTSETVLQHPKGMITVFALMSIAIVVMGIFPGLFILLLYYLL